ncbi:50S ribosomal protein L3 [Firmicutes bacterium CAG:884]|jgi:large subunit ribosomal protein L3|nr:50S ribosomal protein L3 [Firmicutes bacterium CAG:884]
MKGILGRKKGMTQVFTKSGKLIPVTVIEVEPNVVTQIKTKENDGYEAIQLGFENIKEKNATKAIIGHAKKANTTPKRFFREIRGVDVANYNVGDEISVDSFTEGEVVDVTGTTKGHGFEGVITRHGQSRGPMGHGSHYHRKPGSMGTMRPMRVFKAKKLPGHMGVLTVTIQNLEVVKVDKENNCILIKGNVPGAKEGLVFIKTSIKTPGKVNETEELLNYITVEDVVESEVSSEQTETEVNE